MRIQKRPAGCRQLPGGSQAPSFRVSRRFAGKPLCRFERAAVGFALILFSLFPALANAQTLTNCTAAGLAAALAQDGAVVLMTNCSVTLSSPVSITGNVTLSGSGTNVTVSGNAATRLFEVQPGASLTILSLTLTGGNEQHGGGVYVHPNARAYFSNCVFSVNWAIGASAATNGLKGEDSWSKGDNGQPGLDGTNGLGGAIFNLGESTLVRCRLANNRAKGGDGGRGGRGGDGGWEGGNGGRGGNGATGRGGAIYNRGTLIVNDSSFEGNTAIGGSGALGGSGGDGPSAGVAGSGGYGARAVGAAVFNEGFASISGSTFVTNAATGGNSAADGTLNGGTTGGDGYNGGGAFGGAICNMDSLTTTNCTFYGNKAVGGAGANGGNGSFEAGDGGDGGEGYGGALYNTGVQWFVNCTLAQNSVAGGTNGIAGSGARAGTPGDIGPTLGAGVLTTSSSEFNMKNSILSANTGAVNGTGSFNDLGHNLSSDASIALGSSSFKNKNPRLGSLADNGGPTRTMLPQPGSPAVRAADMNGAPDSDQRGLPRPGPGKSAPDIGSVEVQPPGITNQPANQVVALGSSATFTVGVSGDKPLFYFWQRSGTNIPGATSSSFTITNVSAANVGAYRVVVTNAAGRVESSEALLTLGTAPAISTQPAPQTVSPGETASFTVAATGNSPISVQWRSNQVAFPGWTNWTLLLTNVQASFAADYSARVSNSSGSVTSNPARLTVLSPPAVVPGFAQGTNFAISFPTQTGVTYVTEFKGNLTNALWTPIVTNIGTGSSLTNLDSMTNEPTRYYRIKAL